MEKFNPYKILGIKKTATEEEIKKAYRDAAKLYHPDVKETGDVDKFNLAKKAYDVLVDPKKFELYSAYGIVAGEEESDHFMKAIANLKLLFFNILSQVPPEDLEKLNLMHAMTQSIHQHKSEIKKKMEILKGHMEQNKKILDIFSKRLKYKVGKKKTPNFFMETIVEAMNILPVQIAQLALEIRTNETMEEILKDFSYEFIQTVMLPTNTTSFGFSTVTFR